MSAIAAALNPQSVTNLVETLHVNGKRSSGYFSIQQYHADRSCVSCSLLKEILRSPAHFRAAWNGEVEINPPSPFFGQAMHDFLLNPKLFKQFYEVKPHEDVRIADARQFKLPNSNKIILSQLQAEQLTGIGSAVSSHTLARKLLGEGRHEITHIFKDPKTGIWLKFRPDCLCLNDGICLDIKKTQDASPRPFGRAAFDGGYDMQAALCLMGLREIYQRDFDFVFLAIEEIKPNAIALYAAPIEMLERGERRVRAALDTLKECRDKDFWPAYQPDGGYDFLEWSPLTR
ncbi:MAG: PD-(D/E)XK nuclease-like domain-containing protein [Zoogloeaceae bacterium]|nr:PD-(D/E)XK nuclease-like domain-containing protein [Zoogloeaceae bacterium]